ncbi:MAG TPA: ABC transporter permease [Planctomycetota bacterium]|nr:ABC transporter permease [Planctomycetota bacterium]
MAEAATSPLGLALGYFLRMHSVRIGLGVLALFVLVAIYAPFLASETAIVWRDADGVSFPLFAELFNRRSYPQRHDLLFNLLVFLAPALAIAWWALRRRWRPWRRVLWSLAIVTVAWIACQVPMLPSGGSWQAVWNDRPSPEETVRRHRAFAADDAPGAVFALVPHRYDAPYQGAILRRPGTVNESSGRAFLLGSDAVGFDVFARMVFGARISLTIGLVATGLSLLIGTIIGALSGYLGGWVDIVLQRLVEIMMCFPTFILVLTVIAMTSRSIFIIMIVLGLTGWAGTARLVRGEFLSQSVREYVTAAHALGLPQWRIMFRHILPNSLSPLLISATFGVAGSIFTESGLAFLGLGDPNAPSWGLLLNQGRENIAYSWLIYIPGLAVFALLTALNQIGNGLREALDPKSQR